MIQMLTKISTERCKSLRQCLCPPRSALVRLGVFCAIQRAPVYTCSYMRHNRFRDAPECSASIYVYIHLYTLPCRRVPQHEPPQHIHLSPEELGAIRVIESSTRVAAVSAVAQQHLAIVATTVAVLVVRKKFSFSRASNDRCYCYCGLDL
ncbi:unnamed protein product [Trichogramma brassicae]|uniref:Uncharacterized protein n=1 Tax=Trichogramma brassicae TaxID=86971 RepID=A0A6H5IM14_9HYME|nr:unnamed protein product [Trichogramma brassicae]